MALNALQVAEHALAAATRQDAAAAFATALRGIGATYFQARLYQRPRGRLTSGSHWQAGGVLTRDAAPGWVGSAAFNYICFDNNPLLEPIRLGMTRYRFSDFAPAADPRYGPYWDALGEARIADAICATAYGRDGMIASAHMGISSRDVDATVVQTLAIAGSIFVERLMALGGAQASRTAPKLTGRQRDTLGFVAEGKTDWEIAQILGISETTARYHIDTARRRLGAVSRSHAVARLIAEFGPL